MEIKKVVILMIFFIIDNMTTAGMVSGDNYVKMTTFSFQ